MRDCSLKLELNVHQHFEYDIISDIDNQIISIVLLAYLKNPISLIQQWINSKLTGLVLLYTLEFDPIKVQGIRGVFIT